MSPPSIDHKTCNLEESKLQPEGDVIVQEATKQQLKLEEALEAAGAGDAGLWMIGKLMQVASLARAEVGVSAPAEKCAILPWESKKKLVLSDISLKLHRVRRFLERDIGYILLDDASAASRGNVVLCAPKNHRRRKGPVATEPQSTDNSQSGPQDNQRKDRPDNRLPPDMARFASYPDDLVLVGRFMDTLDGCAVKAKSSTLCKTLLQGVRLMHMCKYSYADIVLTLAYTSVYFRQTVAHITQNMCDYEAAHVCALLMYLAHSFILDETCPLRFWQQNIFKQYCTLKILDTALFRLFALLNFKLRIPAEQEQHALSIMLSDTAGESEKTNLNA